MTRPSCFFASDVARAVDEVRMLADESSDTAAFLRAVARELKAHAEIEEATAKADQANR